MRGRAKSPEHAAAASRSTLRFGVELVRTKVFLIAPAGRDEIAIDITDYMWEGEPA